MTKKLLGLLVVALLGVGLASGMSITQGCSGGAGANGAGGNLPSASGFSTCPSFTIPVGDTLTSVEIVMNGDYQLALSGGNTLVWTYTMNGAGNSATLNPQPSTQENVEGNSGVSSAYVWSNPAGCSSPDNVFPLADGSDCTTGEGINSGTLFQAFNVTISGAWAGGSAGISTSGSEGAQVVEAIYTYVPTGTVPEPATLLMIGGGLIGLAVYSRRKRNS